MHLHAVRLARGDQRVTVEMRGLTNWSVIDHSKEVVIDLGGYPERKANAASKG